MRKAHNRNKIYVKGLGYQPKDYKKRNVFSFIRLFSITLAITGVCAAYRVFNQPVELINPLISINYVQPEAVKAVSIPEEVEVDKCSLIENEIEQYICEVFGDEYENAMEVLSCENKGLNHLAINDANSNGSTDVGIFQINSIHGFTVEEMQDYKKNVDFAYKLMKRDGWSAWACSHKIGVTPFYLK